MAGRSARRRSDPAAGGRQRERHPRRRCPWSTADDPLHRRLIALNQGGRFARCRPQRRAFPRCSPRLRPADRRRLPEGHARSESQCQGQCATRGDPSSHRLLLRKPPRGHAGPGLRPDAPNRRRPRSQPSSRSVRPFPPPPAPSEHSTRLARTDRVTSRICPTLPAGPVPMTTVVSEFRVLHLLAVGRRLEWLTSWSVVMRPPLPGRDRVHALPPPDPGNHRPRPLLAGRRSCCRRFPDGFDPICRRPDRRPLGSASRQPLRSRR